MNHNGTGIIYPEVELGGTKYLLSITQGTLIYRMSAKGISIAKLNDPATRVAATFDLLHAIIQDRCPLSAEQLAELAYDEKKIPVVTAAILEAVGKVFPPPIQPATAAGIEAPPKLQ